MSIKLDLDSCDIEHLKFMIKNNQDYTGLLAYIVEQFNLQSKVRNNNEH